MAKTLNQSDASRESCSEPCGSGGARPFGLARSPWQNKFDTPAIAEYRGKVQSPSGKIISTAVSPCSVGRLRLAFASVYTPIWNSGLTLAACLFLPIFMTQGCSAKRPEYPYEWYQGVKSVSDVFQIQLQAWPYLFGILVSVGALVIVVTRKPCHFRTLWAVYALAISVVVLGLWSIEAKQYREQADNVGLQPLLNELWILVPTTCLVAALLLTYLNCRTWFSAALWVQWILSALSCAWFVFVAVSVGDDLLYGGKLSIGASLLLFVGTGCERLWGLEALGIRQAARKRAGSPALVRKPSEVFLSALA